MHSDNEDRRIAIVGAGNMAREHIRAFAGVPGVRVAGIQSRTRTRADALAAELCIPSVCETVAELYERTGASLVVVTVPPDQMRQVGKSCFEFPWTVLLEKPPGLDVSEAEDILLAASTRGRQALVGLNRRFLSSTETVMQDLASRNSPRFVHAQDQQDLEVAKTLGHSEAVVEKWMYANSIHVIDCMRFLCRGKVRSVDPICPWKPGKSHVAAAKIEFDSGDTALYEGVWNGPGPWAVSVTTEEIRWEMRPLEQAAFQSRGTRTLNRVEPTRMDQEFKPGFRLQAEMAVRAALGQSSQCPTLEDALETMCLIEAIFSDRHTA